MWSQYFRAHWQTLLQGKVWMEAVETVAEAETAGAAAAAVLEMLISEAAAYESVAVAVVAVLKGNKVGAPRGGVLKVQVQYDAHLIVLYLW